MIWGASWNFASIYHYIIRKCVSKSWTFSNASQSFFWPFYFRVSIYSTYFFFRILNNIRLLFEYSNNIRIFILLNKLLILGFSPKFQKKSNWVEITEYNVLGLICTQKSQQITKLVLYFFWKKMAEMLHFYMVY
jgi:hypothetical protein